MWGTICGFYKSIWVGNNFFYVEVSFLSTEWVDGVEEPMKYQTLRPQFFSMGGWGGGGWWDGWWGGWTGGGDGGDPFGRHAAMWLFH